MVVVVALVLFVCRDDQGRAILTGTRACQANWSIEMSEAMAAYYGLVVAKRMGFEKVHIKGDALSVISAIHNKASGRSPLFIVYDLLFSLLRSFMDFRASFVNRQGNTAAHMVARWETTFDSESVYASFFGELLYFT